MSMRPGHQRHVGKLDDLVGVGADAPVGVDGRDVPALDADVRVVDHVAGVDVEHAARGEQLHVGFGHGRPFASASVRSCSTRA